MTDAIRDNNHVPVALGQSNTDATNTLPFLVDSVTGKLLVDGGGGGGNAWELTGNAGTTPGTNFVGTTDDVDLSFTTDDTERFRLLSTANSGADIVAFEALVDEFQFYGEGESTPFLKRAVSADETTLTSTTGTLTLDTAGAYVESPYFGLSNNTPLQFYNAADANYVGFQVGTLTGNTTYTLPEDYPATSGDVLSSTDAGVMSWITPGGGGGGIQTATITLTASQMNALNGTSQTILAAQGANKVIVPVGLSVFFDYSSSFNTGGADLEVGYTNGSQTIFGVAWQTFEQIEDCYYFATPMSSNVLGAGGTFRKAFSTVANAPLKVFNQNTNYTGGTDSTVTFTISYYVIDYN